METNHFGVPPFLETPMGPHDPPRSEATASSWWAGRDELRFLMAVACAIEAPKSVDAVDTIRDGEFRCFTHGKWGLKLIQTSKAVKSIKKNGDFTNLVGIWVKIDAISSKADFYQQSIGIQKGLKHEQCSCDNQILNVADIQQQWRIKPNATSRSEDSTNQTRKECVVTSDSSCRITVCRVNIIYVWQMWCSYFFHCHVLFQRMCNRLLWVCECLSGNTKYSEFSWKRSSPGFTVVFSPSLFGMYIIYMYLPPRKQRIENFGEQSMAQTRQRYNNCFFLGISEE